MTVEVMAKNRYHRFVRNLLIISSLCFGCVASGGGTGADDKDLNGLVTKIPPPKLTEAMLLDNPAEWFALALANYPAQSLGAHRLKSESQLQLKDSRVLNVESTLDFVSPTEFRAVTNNDKDLGVDYILHNDEVYVRQRYGKYHRRPVVSQEEIVNAQLRVASDFASYVHAVADNIAIEKQGDAKCIAPCQQFKLSLAAEKVSKGILASAKIKNLTGDMKADATTGMIFEGELSVIGTITMQNQPSELTIKVTHRVGAPSVDAIEIPQKGKWVRTHKRIQDVSDRNKLLKGLAPPVGVQ